MPTVIRTVMNTADPVMVWPVAMLCVASAVALGPIFVRPPIATSSRAAAWGELWSDSCANAAVAGPATVRVRRGRHRVRGGRGPPRTHRSWSRNRGLV